MSKQSEITQAMINHLKTLFPDGDTDLVDSVETDYTPVLDKRYLETRIFTSDTETRAVGLGKYRYQGILQVTVVYPRLSGVSNAQALADTVVSLFEKGTVIDGDGVRIRIIRQPSQASAVPDGAWLRVPVSINYNCMA